MARKKSHERSMGTMISTVCFFLMAMFLFLQAADFLDAGYRLRGTVLAVCGMCCVAGGMRYVIHDLVAKLRSKKR